MILKNCSVFNTPPTITDIIVHRHHCCRFIYCQLFLLIFKIYSQKHFCLLFFFFSCQMFQTILLSINNKFNRFAVVLKSKTEQNKTKHNKNSRVFFFFFWGMSTKENFFFFDCFQEKIVIVFTNFFPFLFWLFSNSIIKLVNQ